MPDEQRTTGYRATPGHGPRLRSDVFDVYIFRRLGSSGTTSTSTTSIELLQLLRADAPMRATWQPVMGHIEQGEHAIRAALRELVEEIALEPTSPTFLTMWALEQVWPYYLPELDTIVLSPRFVVEVAPTFTPTLNHEHTDYRWIGAPTHQPPNEASPRKATDLFLWPGQQHAITEILDNLLPPDRQAAEHLRIDHHARW